MKLILDKISGDADVRKVIIFVSSMTSARNLWSDINVYFGLDTWTNFTVDTDLLHEVLEKGVVMFEQNFI